MVENQNGWEYSWVQGEKIGVSSCTCSCNLNNSSTNLGGGCRKSRRSFCVATIKPFIFVLSIGRVFIIRPWGYFSQRSSLGGGSHFLSPLFDLARPFFNLEAGWSNCCPDTFSTTCAARGKSACCVMTVCSFVSSQVCSILWCNGSP